jgi:hypothetical protein
MTPSRHAVRKLGWYQPPHGDPYTRRLPSADGVATFGSFDEAEADRSEREADARAGENPFRFGGASVFFQSSLDGPRLHDWLMDAGIDPPESELRHADWRGWWDAFAHTWSADQLAHAWAAFDKVRFFDVAETPPETAHVTVAIANDHRRNPVPRIERARLLGVSRRPRRAGRRPVGGWADVFPVPSDVPPRAGVGFLVQRRGILYQTFSAERNEPPDNNRVPLAVFADRAAAEGYRDRLAAAGRRTLNPFVFVEPDTGPATAGGRAALAGLGFALPVPDHTRRADWLEWYDLCQDEATDAQRAAVWDRCDRPLFEVVRVEVTDE